jgi:simple sugar transport system ATP-binding protein
MTPTFQLKNVVKSFGRVSALCGVDFVIYPGEIVGLLGDNGAGKSTLVRVISGVHEPDSGELYFKGERRQRWNARLARDLGIETVHQEKALAEQQTVAQNIFLGRELTNRLGFIRVRDQNEQARRLMRAIGFTSRVFNERSPVDLLSGGERQGVAIARALHFKAELIMLDEPTNALAVSEVDQVLNFVRRIKEEGRSGIFISHNIAHAHAVCDRVVLLDRGRVVDEHRPSDITLDHLISTMHDLSHAGRMA